MIAILVAILNTKAAILGLSNTCSNAGKIVCSFMEVPEVQIILLLEETLNEALAAA